MKDESQQQVPLGQYKRNEEIVSAIQFTDRNNLPEGVIKNEDGYDDEEFLYGWEDIQIGNWILIPKLNGRHVMDDKDFKANYSKLPPSLDRSGSQPGKEAGSIRWVKSPEVPKEKGAYWCKLNDGLGSKNGAYFNGEKWESYREEFILEWLNENPQPSQPVQGKEDEYDLKEIINNLTADLEKKWNEYYPLKGNRTWKIKLSEENSEEYKASLVQPHDAQPHKQGKEEQPTQRDWIAQAKIEYTKMFEENNKLRSELAALKSKPSDEEIDVITEIAKNYAESYEDPENDEMNLEETIRLALIDYGKWLSSYKQTKS